MILNVTVTGVCMVTATFCACCRSLVTILAADIAVVALDVEYGMIIAAAIAMMITTMSNSTRVNPLAPAVLSPRFFIGISLGDKLNLRLSRAQKSDQPVEFLVGLLLRFQKLGNPSAHSTKTIHRAARLGYCGSRHHLANKPYRQKNKHGQDHEKQHLQPTFGSFNTLCFAHVNSSMMHMSFEPFDYFDIRLYCVVKPVDLVGIEGFEQYRHLIDHAAPRIFCRLVGNSADNGVVA